MINETDVAQCSSCWRKKDKPEDHPRITRTYGNPEAPILILTHQPRQLALRDNYPLVGKQLSFLRERLKEIGIELHQDTQMVNIVRCVGESLKLPMVRNCSKFCDPIMRAEKTKLVLALGRPVATYIFGRGKSVSMIDSLAGKAVKQFDLENKVIMVLRHPEEIINTALEDEGLYDQMIRKNKVEFKSLQTYIKSDEELTAWLNRKR